MEESGPLGCLRIQAELGSHYRTDVCNLAGVLEQVLSVRRTVFHAAYQLDELDVHSVYAEVNAGPLSGLENLVLKLLLDLCYDFLDAGRVDTAVDYELMQGEPCNLAPHRVECGQQNGVRSVVHHDFHTCGSLQGPDVPSFTSDDTAFDLVVFDRECSHCILDGSLGGCPLDGGDYYPFSLFCSIQAGVVHGVVDISLGLASRLCLHVLHEDVLGLCRRQSGNAFDLLVGLLPEGLIFFGLPLEILLLGLDSGLCVLEFGHLPLEFLVLLVETVLLLPDAVLGVLYLGVFLVYLLLMFALELEIFLLGLKDFLFLDVFRLKFSLFYDAVLAAFHYNAVNREVDGDSERCRQQCGSCQY